MRSVQWTSTQGMGGLYADLANFKPYLGRRPSQLTGLFLGADTLRGTPPPTPPNGVLPWQRFSEVATQITMLEPQKLNGPLPSTEKLDQQVAWQYGSYGVRNVRDYGRLLERSLNWWRGTAFFKDSIANVPRAYVADFFTKATRLISLLKTA